MLLAALIVPPRRDGRDIGHCTGHHSMKMGNHIHVMVGAVVKVSTIGDDIEIGCVTTCPFLSAYFLLLQAGAAPVIFFRVHHALSRTG